MVTGGTKRKGEWTAKNRSIKRDLERKLERVGGITRKRKKWEVEKKEREVARKIKGEREIHWSREKCL